ncbi:hypothetical protein D3C72_1586320 [compost metagenome]
MDVRLEQPLRLHAVARERGLHDRFVLTKVVARRLEVARRQLAVTVRAVVQLCAQLQQHLVAAGANQHGVEMVVPLFPARVDGVAVTGQLVRLLQPVIGAQHRGLPVVVPVRDGPAQGECLDLRTGGRELQQLVAADRRHREAALIFQRHQPLAHEPHQRLADRCLARADGLGQGRDHEPLPGRHVPMNDVVAQAGQQLRGLGAFDARGGRGRFAKRAEGGHGGLSVGDQRSQEAARQSTTRGNNAAFGFIRINK